MNNEPVAWMLTDRVVSSVPIKGAIPLYTHPHSDKSVKAKTLTDEEILNLFEPKYDVEIDDEMLVDFARAILRKAQK